MEGQAGPKPGERSWPARRPPRSVLLSFSPSVRLLYFPPPLLPRLPPTLSRGRPSHFYFVCAAPRRDSLSLLFSPSAPAPPTVSLLRRAKMVHGRSRTPISPRILRGGSTSYSPLSCASPPGPATLFATLLLAGRHAVAPRFFFAVFLSLCTRLHRSPF